MLWTGKSSPKIPQSIPEFRPPKEEVKRNARRILGPCVVLIAGLAVAAVYGAGFARPGCQGSGTVEARNFAWARKWRRILEVRVAKAITSSRSDVDHLLTTGIGSISGASARTTRKVPRVSAGGNSGSGSCREAG